MKWSRKSGHDFDDNFSTATRRRRDWVTLDTSSLSFLSSNTWRRSVWYNNRVCVGRQEFLDTTKKVYIIGWTPFEEKESRHKKSLQELFEDHTSRKMLLLLMSHEKRNNHKLWFPNLVTLFILQFSHLISSVTAKGGASRGVSSAGGSGGKYHDTFTFYFMWF